MPSSEDYLIRGQRALDWSVSLVDRENGFPTVGNAINGYYKSVVALTTGARLREARVIARFIEHTFYDKGDFNGLKGDPTAKGLANYRNAWLGRGLHILGRYDLARATGNVLEASLHSETGGMAALPNLTESDRLYCFGTTGSGVLSLIAMGRVQAAIHAGRFLESMVDDQPVTKGKFYLWRDASGKIVRRDAEPGETTVYNINIGTSGQVYWYLGIALNAFGSLFLATGDTRWRDAGYKVYEYFNNCADDVYESITNGKVAWGLGWMYAATRDPQFSKAAQEVWDWHCQIQDEDGYWLRRGQFKNYDEQPLHVTLDTTFERAFYMLELARTLDI